MHNYKHKNGFSLIQLLITLAVIAILAALLIPQVTQAQTASTNVPAQIAPFYDQAFAWGTSIDYAPAKAWTNSANGNIELSDGVKEVTGFGAKDYLIGQYDIGSGAWSVGAEVNFDGIGSVLNGGELVVGYAIVRAGDFKVEITADGGYDANNYNVECIVLEPGITVKKKLTANTFAEIAISEPVYLRGKFNSSPTIMAGAGCLLP